MFTNRPEKFTSCLPTRRYSSNKMRKRWLFVFIAALILAASIPTYVFGATTADGAALPASSGDNSAFIKYSNIDFFPETLTSNSWKINFPPETRGRNPATSHILTKESYAINVLSFTARFVENRGSSFEYDEFAVFGATDVTKYQGYEFGIRNSLQTGKVLGYIQYPDGNSTSTKDIVLFAENDGLLHEYQIELRDTKIVYFVDGTEKGTIDYGIRFQGREYSIVALGHRFTDGWEYNNAYMTLENPVWDNTIVE